MKIKWSKDLIIFIILIPLLLWIALSISSRTGKNLPYFSVINKSRMGCSVFYEALKDLKYPVDRSLKSIDSHGIDDMQIVTNTSNFDVNSDKIKNWIERGGILIYLTPENFHNIDYDVSPEIKGNITLYKYKKGAIIASDVLYITNKNLVKDRDNAYEILNEISNYPNKKLYFNEAHLFSAAEEKTLWSFIPIGIKYILYQLLLVIAAFFYYKGRRFGRPVPFYEETERTENEYLYSTASLYRQAKCWDIMLNNYYKSFLKHINKSHDTWLDYWENEKLPNYDNARRVYEFMRNSDTKPNTKEYIDIVTILEQLDNILKKRRDTYWKAVKKSM